MQNCIAQHEKWAQSSNRLNPPSQLIRKIKIMIYAMWWVVYYDDSRGCLVSKSEVQGKRNDTVFSPSNLSRRFTVKILGTFHARNSRFRDWRSLRARFQTHFQMRFFNERLFPSFFPFEHTFLSCLVYFFGVEWSPFKKDVFYTNQR